MNYDDVGSAMKHKPYHKPRVKIDKGHLETKYNQHKGDFSDEPTTEEYEQRARQMLDAERAQYGELRGFQRERDGSWIIDDDENGVIAMMDKQGNFTTYLPYASDRLRGNACRKRRRGVYIFREI